MNIIENVNSRAVPARKEGTRIHFHGWYEGVNSYTTPNNGTKCERLALTTFLESNESLWAEKTRQGFSRAWLKYLRTRAALPGIVRFLLSRLCARVAIPEVLDELSAKDTSSEELPREFMSEVIARASSGLLRPRRRPVLVLLAANVLWFGVFFVKLRHN